MALSNDTRPAPKRRPLTGAQTEKPNISGSAARLVLLAKYSASGGAAAFAHLLAFSVLSALGTLPTVSSALGFCVAVAVNYLLQYYWTFNYLGSHVTAFRRYLSITLLSFVINLTAFKVLSVHLHFNPLVAQATAIAIVFVFNFSLNSSYSFRRT
jgi:putative flippase GtrA